MQEALREVRPTRVRATSSRWSRSTGPGPMRFIQDYARGKRDPASVALHRRAPARDHRADLRHRALPGAADADRARHRRLPGPARRTRCGRAIGKKKRDLMATLKQDFVEGCKASGTSAAVAQPAVVADGGGRRLLVQQVPRRLLRADRLPHRLSEGELPGRVHGRADLERDVDEGQGPVLRLALRGDGHRGAAAGREHLRPRLRGRRGRHPVRARRGQERRLRGGREDPRGARRAAARSRRSGTSARGSTRAPSTRRRSRA